MPALRPLFLLDPEVIFLNHGSFGACPRPVIEDYHAWQIKLENQPVQFLGVELPGRLRQVRETLGSYLNGRADDLVMIPNATFGVNAVARSLNLKPGDEVLASDHEYGACDKTWEFLCGKSGAVYKHQPISMPATPQEMLDQLWAGVTHHTRLIFVSHITSPTAQTLPVVQLCARARQAGILTLVDGAHAPGQIGLDLEVVGADFYTGNCHKWMLAPKGSAFLHARRDAQALLEPLVVSWGWQPDEAFSSGSQFVDLFQWRGTDDPSACLAVPAAMQFMRENDWEGVRRECHALLTIALEHIEAITGLPPPYPDSQAYRQMAVAELPRQPDLAIFKQRLLDDYRVEIPCISWNGRHFLRISVQGYNTQADIDCLITAVSRLLRE